MTCAACSARVQRSLEKAPGVEGANVNLMTNSAKVVYDPVRTSPYALAEVIRQTGYGAELPRAGASVEMELDREDAEGAEELRRLRKRVAASLVAAVLAAFFLLDFPLLRFPLPPRFRLLPRSRNNRGFSKSARSNVAVSPPAIPKSLPARAGVTVPPTGHSR